VRLPRIRNIPVCHFAPCSRAQSFKAAARNIMSQLSVLSALSVEHANGTHVALSHASAGGQGWALRIALRDDDETDARRSRVI